MTIEILKQKYKRRLTAFNITVKRLRSEHSKELPYYVGRTDELEKVIDDLDETL